MFRNNKHEIHTAVVNMAALNRDDDKCIVPRIVQFRIEVNTNAFEVL